MSTPIKMPQLGESVAEGTIGRWLKQPGDQVAKDEPLVEIITDKVNAELPSPVAGRVEALLVEEGTTVGVGHEIARIVEGAGAEQGPAPAALDTPAAPPGPAAPPAAEEPASAESDAGMFAGSLDELDAPLARSITPAAPPGPAAPAPAAPPREDDGQRRIRSSPLVRRLAEEHQVDLSGIRGTGMGGRITKDDLLSYLAERGQPAPAVGAPVPAVELPAAQAAVPAEPAPAPAPALPALPPTLAAGEERVPLSPMRRMIAEHLTRNQQTVPQAWTTVEVDVSGLVRWREAAREEFRRRAGVDLTYLAPFVQVVVEALKAEPVLNARWADDHIVMRRGIHVGIAVAIDEGLIVPVLHDADERNLVGLARGLADLVARARAGTLTLSDVQGGTFTVNNTGAFGSVVSMPIVPQGQSGIITMEAIVKRPVVVDDAIAIRSMMNVCLTFDHRVLDGAPVGRFLQDVKRRLERFQPPF
jgi:2-oxoisovalerate dehydrogenase E2 component (dihydrolipoyl transacylase)